MTENQTDRKKSVSKQEILDVLLDDPTKSKREIANILKSNRNTIWRKWNQMEKEHLIWGYTAVIDENNQDKHIFLILMKTKPMIKDMADIVVIVVSTARRRKIDRHTMCVVQVPIVP